MVKQTEPKLLGRKASPISECSMVGLSLFFMALQPYGYATCTLSCLLEDGKDVPKVSRVEARVKEAKIEMDKRHVGNAGNK